MNRGLEDPLAIALSVISPLAFVIIYRGYRDLHRPLFEWGWDVFTAGLGAVVLTVAVLYLHVSGRPPLAAVWLPAGVISLLTDFVAASLRRVGQESRARTTLDTGRHPT